MNTTSKETPADRQQQRRRRQQRRTGSDRRVSERALKMDRQQEGRAADPGVGEEGFGVGHGELTHTKQALREHRRGTSPFDHEERDEGDHAAGARSGDVDCVQPMRRRFDSGIRDAAEADGREHRATEIEIR